MYRNRLLVTLIVFGTSWSIASAGQPQACCLPDGTCVVIPVSDCIGHNGTPMGVDDCSLVDCPEPGDWRFEFSLDIGSDKEMSDPFRDGDEGFDPGDVYWWQGAPVNFPGRDGFKDDRLIFNFDPFPDPPDPAYATSVPVGAGHIELYREFFDLDGHDQLGEDLIEMGIISVTHPLEMPIPKWDTPCIHGIDFLMISMDDDMGPGWPVGDVPVMVPSPAGVSSYGSSAGRDEVIGVNVVVLPGPPPYPLMGTYSIADEVTVHQSLRQNPDGDEREDDDVDSLDIVRSQDECPFWYFSADHEAYLGLDPGDIYLATSAGPVPVIDEVMHLGLPDETDIDAFEFVWLVSPEDPDGGLYLALIFSVDDDDPLTPGDESGGLLPNMIYGSFLTGWSFPLIHEELWDDIDAITAWEHPIEPEPTGACCLGNCACSVMTAADCVANGGSWVGPGTDCNDYDGDGFPDACFTCLGDLNCDGFVNIADLAQLLAHYGMTGMTYQQGDMDGDGDVDLADLAALLAAYGGC